MWLDLITDRQHYISLNKVGYTSLPLNGVRQTDNFRIIFQIESQHETETGRM